MNTEDIIKIINEKYKINISEKIEKDLDVWHKLFLEYSSHTNLMSKNDIKIVFEKHVVDSLALSLAYNLNQHLKVLDVGCGGGFPSLILSIFFRNLKITGVDSTAKKIKFLEIVKNELKLDNFTPINNRIENLTPQDADIMVSRAVGNISKIYELSKKHLAQNGKFVFYKSKNYEEELLEFQKKYKKHIEILPYTLPTPENHKRCLIIISQNQGQDA